MCSRVGVHPVVQESADAAKAVAIVVAVFDGAVAFVGAGRSLVDIDARHIGGVDFHRDFPDRIGAELHVLAELIRFPFAHGRAVAPDGRGAGDHLGAVAVSRGYGPGSTAVQRRSG